jgi:hypothetical protein
MKKIAFSPFIIPFFIIALFFILVLMYFFKLKEGYYPYYYGGPARGLRGDYDPPNFYYGTPYGGGWYNPLSWYGYYYNEPLYYSEQPASCKTGCTNLGNGEWGCLSLGRSWNNCWFAKDCATC